MTRAEQLERLRRPADPRPEVVRESARRAAAFDREPGADWYHIGPILAAAADEPDEADDVAATSADVYVFGSVGGWFGVTAKDFVRDVAGLDVDQIVVHLNTPGGDAFEGVAIANVLRAHRARVVVRVDGMAASAGSVIAMAGDEVIMGIGSSMMVHDAWGWCVGSAEDVAKYAERLSTTSNAIAETYAAKAGGTRAEWRVVMQAETWYAAEEAVEAGLADRVAAADETGTAEGEQITPGGSLSFWDMWDSLSDQGRHDLSAYRYAGRGNAPAPAMPGRPAPAADAAGSRNTTQEGSPAVAFSDAQLTTLRQRLGTADDADEATILAALDERLADRATPQNPPGTVVLDEAQHEQLLADARDGREARAQQLQERREGLVAAAVRDGRIPPARREHWLAQLAADPESEQVLADLKPGLVPVDEIGYGKDEPTDPAAADDYWFPGVPGAAKKTEG